MVDIVAGVNSAGDNKEGQDGSAGQGEQRRETVQFDSTSNRGNLPSRKVKLISYSKNKLTFVLFKLILTSIYFYP